jgi:nucleotide-binding universal stress UspA family protein
MKFKDVRRILVALDASPHSHAALEEAAAMAARLEAELVGIFVLDTELLRFSALPVARETGLTSALRRTLDPERMERALRLQAGRARLDLEKAARTHRLQSTFQLARGNVLSELLEAAGQADLVAMGAMGHMALTGRRLGSTVRGITTRAACSVLLLTPEVRRGGAVVAVYDQSPHAEQALALAAQLAVRSETNLVVLLSGSEAELPTLKEQAEAEAAGLGVQAIFETIGSEEFQGVNAILGKHDCRLLVLGQGCELIEGHDEEIGDLDAPVLLAR